MIGMLPSIKMILYLSLQQVFLRFLVTLSTASSPFVASSQDIWYTDFRRAFRARMLKESSSTTKISLQLKQLRSTIFVTALFTACFDIFRLKGFGEFVEESRSSFSSRLTVYLCASPSAWVFSFDSSWRPSKDLSVFASSHEYTSEASLRVPAEYPTKSKLI